MGVPIRMSGPHAKAILGTAHDAVTNGSAIHMKWFR